MFRFKPHVFTLRHIRFIKAVSLVLPGLLLSYHPSPVWAVQPGTVDTGFSGDGIATVDINGHDDQAVDTAVQADGKIIVAGTCDTEMPNPCYAVARFHADGTLDDSFGVGGIAQTSFSGDDTEVAAVALQDDGKIVVAGKSGGYNNTAITLVRYTAAGMPDLSFASNGVVATQVVAATHNWGNDLAIQPDGKIVVAGTVWNGSYDFVVQRYDTDGTPDASFGTGGTTITDLGDWEFGYGLALQQDGRVIVAGRKRINGDNSQYDFTLVRYTADGDPDMSFNGTGYVITPATGSVDSINRLLVQPDGKIDAVGTAGSSTLAVARYLPTGILDAEFGGDGIAETTLGDDGYGVALQADGKIMASGYKGSTATDLVVFRFTADGNVDADFGAAGAFTLGLGTIYGGAGGGLARQGNGSVVTTGKIDNGTGMDRNFDFLVIRLNGDPFPWPMFLPAATGGKK